MSEHESDAINYFNSFILFGQINVGNLSHFNSSN